METNLRMGYILVDNADSNGHASVIFMNDLLLVQCQPIHFVEHIQHGLSYLCVG